MKTLLLVDAAPGEVRAGRFDAQGRALALYAERASERKTRAQAGVLYCGRVRAVDPARHAAFVDLGLGAPGFLPLGTLPDGVRVHEGAALAVSVHREAIAEKGPVLRLAPDQTPCAHQPCPSRLKPAPEFVARITARGDMVREADREGRDRLDEAFAAALEPRVPLPGGGALWIEPTHALVGIDVDTARSTAPAHQVNMQAIAEIRRQLDLRRLGGLVAIDFAPSRGARARKALEARLAETFAAPHERLELAPLGRFGAVLLSRPRPCRSVVEVMLDDTGQPSVETLALAALRALENEHRANPGKALVLHVPPKLMAWLTVHERCWADSLKARLGGRLDVRESAHLLHGHYEVTAQ